MLDQALKIIEENKFNVYELTQIKGGVSKTVSVSAANRLNNVYSLSKTFTATAVGILLMQGKLSLETPLIDCFGRGLPKNADLNWKDATVAHLLTHTLGQKKGYLFEEERQMLVTEQQDWLCYILSQPLLYRPGERMVYSNSVYYLLSVVVERAVGKTLFDFLKEELFVPFAFTGYASGCCPKGHTIGATEMFFGSADIAKLGQLYLDGGIFAGKRIFTEDWAKAASTATTTDGKGFYGYSFWKNSQNASAFYGDGRCGQLLLIDPPSRTVLAMQGYDPRLDTSKFVAALTEKK